MQWRQWRSRPQILGGLSSSFPPVPSIYPYAGSNDLLPLSPTGSPTTETI